MEFRSARLLLLALAALLVLAAVFGFAFGPIAVSQDEWWHLKAGKWIWEHGLRPPRNDIFAFTSSDLCWDNPKPYRWDNHEWLAQVAMYRIYALGEVTGIGPVRAVVAAKTLVLLATFALVGLFAWRRSNSPALALLFVVVAAAAGRRAMQPRPPVLTYLLIVAFHFVLWAHRAGRLRGRWLLALPLVTALWANLHGGFILGGLLIACYFAGEVWECLWARRTRAKPDFERSGAAFRRGRILLGIGLLSGLFSLATPFGWRLYLLTHRVMSDKTLVSLIWELQPPNLGQSWAYVALFSFVAIAGALCWRRIFLGEALWIGLLFQQSFFHQRHLALFAVAAAPLACELAASLRGRLALRPRAAQALDLALCAATSALSIGWLTHHPLDPLDAAGKRCASYFDRARELMRGHAYSVNDYPVRLADFIEDAQFHGRMFNDSRYAGYLIWRFSPERHQVFTDMRYDIFGGDFLAEDIAGRSGAVTVQFDDGATRTLDWRGVYEKWNVNFAILDKLTGWESPRPIIPDIESSSDWARVYQDPGDRGLVIYLKNSPENAELLARCRALAPNGLYRRPGRAPWGR